MLKTPKPPHTIIRQNSYWCVLYTYADKHTTFIKIRVHGDSVTLRARVVPFHSEWKEATQKTKTKIILAIYICSVCALQFTHYLLPT